MARSSAMALIFLLFLGTVVPKLQGRKLLVVTSDTEEGNRVESSPITSEKTLSSIFSSLVFSALPKGTVPSSSPSKKGHATLDNEELFRRHLARINRILQSTPSPGMGH